jgi:hypothetical protein
VRSADDETSALMAIGRRRERMPRCAKSSWAFGVVVLRAAAHAASSLGRAVLALGGHAAVRVEGTVAETLDTGVIFTAEVRVSLSERGKPRVLWATSAPSFV